MQVDDGEIPDENEIDIQAGDTFASPEEIKAAIESLYHDVSATKRMIAVAALFLERKVHLGRQYQPEDLLQEALERIAMGVRKWPTNRLDFPGLIIGVMRSWSSSIEKTKSREDRHVVMEHEFIVADGDDEALNLEDVATDRSTPLEQLETYELDAEGESYLVILKAQYGEDELPAKILNALFKEPFETHEEIMGALGIKESDYRNAWKRLMRAAEKLKEIK